MAHCLIGKNHSVYFSEGGGQEFLEELRELSKKIKTSLSTEFTTLLKTPENFFIDADLIPSPEPLTSLLNLIWAYIQTKIKAISAKNEEVDLFDVRKLAKACQVYDLVTFNLKNKGHVAQNIEQELQKLKDKNRYDCQELIMTDELNEMTKRENRHFQTQEEADAYEVYKLKRLNRWMDWMLLSKSKNEDLLYLLHYQRAMTLTHAKREREAVTDFESCLALEKDHEAQKALREEIEELKK